LESPEAAGLSTPASDFPLRNLENHVTEALGLAGSRRGREVHKVQDRSAGSTLVPIPENKDYIAEKQGFKRYPDKEKGFTQTLQRRGSRSSSQLVTVVDE